MDDALVQDGGIDLIVEELDRCWELTQDQDKASKIEKALFETQRDAKTSFMSYVALRKAQFSTAGECARNVTASGHQGLRGTTRCETHRKQQQQGGDVDGWQLGLRRRYVGSCGPP